MSTTVEWIVRILPLAVAGLAWLLRLEAKVKRNREMLEQVLRRIDDRNGILERRYHEQVEQNERLARVEEKLDALRDLFDRFVTGELRPDR